MEATANGKTYTFSRVDFEISSYEHAIRSLRAEKSHLRRWINEAKRSLQPYSWELADRAAERIAHAERSIAHFEEKYAKIDETIARYKLDIATLKASQA